MTCQLIYYPTDKELMLFKDAIWVTMGRENLPSSPPSSELIKKVLKARHSPIRVLNFCFYFKDIPSNTSVHLCRHVHAVPFVQSLRNDRQGAIDGDAARRDTPIDMMFYCNAEALITIANKRLCFKASDKTREAVRMMCNEAIKVFPELASELVPQCVRNGNRCYEIETCGRMGATHD